jgi:hypothetical protein
MNQAIDMRLTVETDVLRVTVVNTGEQDLRLWSRGNSWGWLMFSLLLAQPGSDQWRELTAKPICWTTNIPHALDLPIGGRLDYELRHEDPSWEGLDDVNAWLSQLLQVRVRLRIPETPEAMAQEVFIGEALTPPCLSKPPHSWLTGQVI